MAISLSIEEQAAIDLSVGDESDIGLSVAEEMVITAYDTEAYTGEYEYTPSASAQTVSISGLRATQDITINPIPSNYGLIGWNGSVLTVT